MQNDTGDVPYLLPSTDKHGFHTDGRSSDTGKKGRRNSHAWHSSVFLLIISGFLFWYTAKAHLKSSRSNGHHPGWSTSKPLISKTLFPSLPPVMEDINDFDWANVSRPICLSFHTVMLILWSKLPPSNRLNWTDCYENFDSKFQCARLTVIVIYC